MNKKIIVKYIIEENCIEIDWNKLLSKISRNNIEYKFEYENILNRKNILLENIQNNQNTNIYKYILFEKINYCYNFFSYKIEYYS